MSRRGLVLVARRGLVAAAVLGRRRRQPANDAPGAPATSTTAAAADTTSSPAVAAPPRPDARARPAARVDPSSPDPSRWPCWMRPSARSSSSSADDGIGRRHRDRGRARVAAVPRRHVRHATPSAARPRRARSSRSRRSTTARPRPSFYADQTAARRRVRLPRDARRNDALRQRRAAGPARRWPVPDGGRVLRLPAERPGQLRFRAAVHRARLRVRRRQHARQRVQRRLVRLLRAGPAPRRLRRHRDGRRPTVGPRTQGRDGRRLLSRHQPALRRVDAAAEPGRDHAAVGDRGQLRQRGPARRAAQHRVRRGVGTAAHGRDAPGGPAVGVRPHRRR